MRVDNIFAFLWLLYFLQGIPYGFQTKFFPIYLRSLAVSLSWITFSSSLMSLPWIFKPLWAPLVDKFGTKLSWVSFNLTGMAVFYLIASFTMSSNVTLTLFIVAGLNIFSATQDIAVDSIMVDMLSAEHIGYGNIAQVVGYKCGSLIGGGLLGWLSTSYSWNFLFFLLSVTYFVSTLIVISPLFSGNLKNSQLNRTKKPASAKYPQKTTETQTNENCSTSKIVKTSPKHIFERYYTIYGNILASPGTVWTIVYVLSYKLGEIGILCIFPMCLMDQGIDASRIAVVTGVWCQACSVLGSFLGGMIAPSKQWDDLIKTLGVLSLARVLTAGILTWYGTTVEGNWLVVVCFDCIVYLLSGAITTATFSLMVTCSQCCPGQHSATHYSMLATFEVLGKLLMTAMSGTIAETIGYNSFFLFCIALLTFPVIILRLESGFVKSRSKVKVDS